MSDSRETLLPGIEEGLEASREYTEKLEKLLHDGVTWLVGLSQQIYKLTNALRTQGQPAERKP